MRRCVQKQLLELAQAVWNGTKYAVAKENDKDAGVVLQECYAGIAAIDKTLSEALSDARYVEYNELLEYVKELLELLNAELKEVPGYEGSVTAEDIMPALNDNLSVLCRELEDEPEVKLEIVFMPYKASMWDCFDSIWKAASEDSRCHVSVVPIPYYEKNSNGELYRYHYEGNSLPDYVRIINCQEYSIQMHRPDIVYIHNPYDRSNYVTSVSPEYYSGELRKYTEILVYVSYFIASSYDDILSAFPYIAPMAILNTNYIIYQSPVQLEMLKEMGLYQNNALVLGSPKLDCYANMTEPGIPDTEWEKCIRSKKTVLLATTLNLLLLQSNDEEPFGWITYMKLFLDSILQSADLTLIWRPHPLMEQTIRSMRPYLMDEYAKLVDSIAARQNCIIDRQPDCRYAFYYSDALISDGASMLMQYMPTQKPVLNIYGHGAGTCRYQAFDISGAYFAAQMIYDDRDQFLRLPKCERLQTIVEGIRRYCSMILQQEDPKKEARLAAMHRSVANSDGTAGEKIHKRIVSELFDR